MTWHFAGLVFDATARMGWRMFEAGLLLYIANQVSGLKPKKEKR